MNVEFVNPVLISIVNVLSTMAKVDAKPGRPAVKQGEVSRGDVTGIIGMTGDKIRGSIAISFPEAVILDIAKRMLNEESAGIDATVTDLVGEITNMVSGGAKKLLGDKGYDFDMALPTVVSGKNHVVDHKSRGVKIVLPFAVDKGVFFVEICFES